MNKYLAFLPHYKLNKSSNTKDVEDIKIGSGAPDLRAFKVEKLNSDPRGTAILAGNQSASSIVSGGGTGGIDVSGLTKLSFGKKKTKAVFR